ncbi:metallophosphoesterase family protein [Tengunoibacter tsumagoiensis]|uniref:Metallophosphoesterase n=1 Tax=Tengunoibacter tsumagoiensis TaxID=2014871 RepID=A0A402A4L3_9CHLR|nr:metallophosphoesterase family protein [Tengunoibacter tsumagoiensis]GCE13945.1 metallophosphoesterase [Tengunoibacter tsumagoiensis]
MRIAIISDIHGNQLAFQAILADLAKQPAVDQMIIAGDLCLNGPCPGEVITMLKALDCPVIQGNVDSDVVNQTSKKGPKKQAVINWTREQIGPDGIEYLRNLPQSYLVTNPKGSDLLVVHANPLNQEEAIFPTSPNSKLEHLLGGLPTTIGALAFGHYHVAYSKRWRHLLLVDTGSCGLPRDGDVRASYAILTWKDHSWQAEHRRIKYDLKAVVKQLKTSGIPNVEKRIKVLTEARY